MYGHARDVVPPAVVEGWLARMTDLEWPRPSTATCLVRLARITDDDARDLSAKARRHLAKVLLGAGTSVELIRPLKAHVSVSTVEQGARFGEALPPGLTLAPAPGNR